jgi:CheY-like chemotaxis protein
MNWLTEIKAKQLRTATRYTMVKAKHVLLIDDNDVDNFLTEHLFRVHSAADRITARRSAVEALKFLEKCLRHPEEFPDVILLDINMPQMDGFQFMEHYAKFPAEIKERCCVVMITSSEAKEDSLRAHSDPNINRFLQKPISSYTMEEIFG